ncbi:MAG: AmmeMemoRadiSam system protein B, partial [Candidatus Aureabacteria bacterium]|nr:AmmeMemoRadiSam system protein B [Candidatus Auribacterota bacterium]
MTTRRRMLPPGWYPESAAETRAAIERFLAVAPPPPVRAAAAVAPHAGWEFSGRLALEAIRAFPPDRETIVVVGGHLSPSDPILAAAEDELETPLGCLRSDGDLLRSITARLPLETDRSPDNTVEVQLPFIKYLFPRSRVLALRAPPSAEAIRLGKAILEASRELKRKVAVLGSTDLTHYGGNYGFAPAGRGERGLNWVREVNDREFIERLLDM